MVNYYPIVVVHVHAQSARGIKTHWEGVPVGQAGTQSYCHVKHAQHCPISPLPWFFP